MSAGTLSVCVNEKSSNAPLHTAALQFLSTIFTEETKSRREVDSVSNLKHATSLSDILNSPSASQLCELLLQVGGVVYKLNESLYKVIRDVVYPAAT